MGIGSARIPGADQPVRPIDADTALVEEVSITSVNINNGKAGSQAHLTAIAYNLKRTINILAAQA